MLDHHNGKSVKDATEDSVTLEDGTTLQEFLSVVPNEIVGTKLLKVDHDESGEVAYLSFGHSYADGRPPTVVAVLEATGDDLRAGNG